jgi:hypothetical protein
MVTKLMILPLWKVMRGNETLSQWQKPKANPLQHALPRSQLQSKAERAAQARERAVASEALLSAGRLEETFDMNQIGTLGSSGSLAAGPAVAVDSHPTAADRAKPQMEPRVVTSDFRSSSTQKNCVEAVSLSQDTVNASPPLMKTV